ncbi:hypothetical protein AYJ56_17195 [Brucella anthropi]|nr:hypothetical protein AYJ56_17195 [Brucella anthropi]
MNKNNELFLLCRSGVESQGNAIHAIAQASGLWAVIKDMTKVTATTAAMNFGAYHAKSCIACFSHNMIVEWLPEARPTGTAFIFRLRQEQLLTASRASESTFTVLVEKRACKRVFRAFLP